MTVTLGALITDFFMIYLVKERNASSHPVSPPRHRSPLFRRRISRGDLGVPEPPGEGAEK